MTARVPLRPLRGGVNGVHEPFTPRLQAANTRAESVVESLNPQMTAKANTNRWLVLVIVCVAQFMVVLDATIVNVALPSIQNGLHFSASSLQWIVNAYTLVFGGFLLLGGRAADLFGRQLLFVAGVVVFTAASLLNGLATTSNVLIGGRALQGLGAALVSPAALSIVTTTFAEGRERTRALGVWSAIAAGGGAVGLVVGGFLTDVGRGAGCSSSICRSGSPQSCWRCATSITHAPRTGPRRSMSPVR
jgi:MFS family permease